MTTMHKPKAIPEHNEIDWQKIDDRISIKISDAFNRRNCADDCAEMRVLKTKLEDMKESLDALWKKTDWIFYTTITTLILVVLRFIFK